MRPLTLACPAYLVRLGALQSCPRHIDARLCDTLPTLRLWMQIKEGDEHETMFPQKSRPIKLPSHRRSLGTVIPLADRIRAPAAKARPANPARFSRSTIAYFDSHVIVFTFILNLMTFTLPCPFQGPANEDG